MREKAIVTIGIIFCGFLVSFNVVCAQTWTQTMAPLSAWTNLACSADGTKLIAASLAGSVYTSSDSGVTWVSNNLPHAEWTGVASSADGSELVAVILFSGTYGSTNSGGSWKLQPDGGAPGEFVAMSANGSNIVVTTVGDSNLYVSTNSGQTFVQKSIGGPNGYVSMSANGTIAVTASGISVIVSTNSGATWFGSSDFAETRDAAVSADGSMIVSKTDSAGGVCISTNKGVTFRRVFSGIPFNNNPAIAISANGSKIFIVGGGVTNIYFSMDSGATWATNGTPKAFQDITCSADGNELIATDGNYIYTSGFSPSPKLNLAFSNTNLNFSWIVPSTNMVLEESPDLMNWTTLTNMPSLNYSNLQEQVTLSSGSGNGFFRLISQ